MLFLIFSKVTVYVVRILIGNAGAVMIKVYHKAIICVAGTIFELEKLDVLLNKRFGREYVIEMAESSMEVMDIIETLKEIGVQTSVIISDYKIKDMSGIDLIHAVHRKYQGIKMMLLADEMDIDFAEKLVNQNSVYSLIKKPFENEQMAHIISDACHQYTTDCELENLMRKLRLSEQEKSLILESISESIIYVDLNKDIKWKNSVADQDLAMWEATGLCYEEIFGFEEVHKDCPMKQVLTSKVPYSIERKFSDDSYKLIRYFPVLDQGNQPIGVVLTILDITDRKIAENMNESLLEMSRFINTTDSIIAMYNTAHGYLKRYFKLKLMCVAGDDFDTSYVEFLGESDQVLKQQQVTTMFKSLKNIIHKNKLDDFVIMENEIGTIIAYPMNNKIMMIIMDDILKDDHIALKFITTIAEQIKMGMNKIENLKKITYQAKHDSNTGLYNREYFMERLEARIEDKRTIKLASANHSVAMIDLNYFKDVNDNFSHIVGDEVLLEIANRLEKSIRNGDVVARMGGDEFAVLFLNHNRREIVRMIKRLQDEVSKPIVINGTGIEVGSSVGIVYDIHKYSDINTILRDADKAMYEAKSDKSGIGRCIFFEKNIQKKVERHQVIEKQLKISDFEEELSLIYQPIVCLADMAIKGYEGFLRWETSDGNSYMPNEFIPIANESDDILLIGKKVMDLALEFVREMDGNGCKDCFINVNLTSKQLMNKNHTDMVKKSIVDGGISSNRLRFDITDQFRDSQVEDVSKNISELRDFGVHINLDDFGTGSSSLVTLNQMDVQEIKIDSSYISKIRFSKAAYKMVKSMISLAKSMDIEVTAEGVEKKEELDLLLELGCDNAQGYYFSKPLPFEEAIELRHMLTV